MEETALYEQLDSITPDQLHRSHIQYVKAYSKTELFACFQRNLKKILYIKLEVKIFHTSS